MGCASSRAASSCPKIDVLTASRGRGVQPALENSFGKKAKRDFGRRMNLDFLLKRAAYGDALEPGWLVLGALDEVSADMLDLRAAAPAVTWKRIFGQGGLLDEVIRELLRYEVPGRPEATWTTGDGKA